MSTDTSSARAGRPVYELRGGLCSPLVKNILKVANQRRPRNDADLSHKYDSPSKTTSRLESLPGEIFNWILAYVLEPKRNTDPMSDSSFTRHKIDTAILAVNKNCHRLGRSYLHHTVPWVRFELNTGLFIDPRWLEIPHMVINHKYVSKDTQWCGKQKTRVSSSLSLNPREYAQDAPQGRVCIMLMFPGANTRRQERIGRMMDSDRFKKNPLTLLITEDYLKPVMHLLRMHEMAYCQWADNTSLAATQATSCDGIKVYARVATGLQWKQYAGILGRAGILVHDTNRLVTIERESNGSVQKVRELKRKRCASDISPSRHTMALAYMICTKMRGDDHLRKGRYLAAYKVYEAGLRFSLEWATRDATQAAQFTVTQDTIFKICTGMRCNKALAMVLGNITVTVTEARSEPANFWTSNLRIYYDDEIAAQQIVHYRMVMLIADFLAYKPTSIGGFRTSLSVMIGQWNTYVQFRGPVLWMADDYFAKVYESAVEIYIKLQPGPVRVLPIVKMWKDFTKVLRTQCLELKDHAVATNFASFPPIDHTFDVSKKFPPGLDEEMVGLGFVEGLFGEGQVVLV